MVVSTEPSVLRTSAEKREESEQNRKEKVRVAHQRPRRGRNALVVLLVLHPNFELAVFLLDLRAARLCLGTGDHRIWRGERATRRDVGCKKRQGQAQTVAEQSRPTYAPAAAAGASPRAARPPSVSWQSWEEGKA